MEIEELNDATTSQQDGLEETLDKILNDNFDELGILNLLIDS